MKKIFIWCLFLCLPTCLYAAEQVEVKGIAEEGGKIAKTVCVACHAADGNSAMADYPKLAGQHEQYLVAALRELKKGSQGKRSNALMASQLANYSDSDLLNLAAYFSQQTMTPGGAAKELVPAGKKLYRAGDAERGIPACMACHGPDGAGNGLARFPRLGGQQVNYVMQQLKNFRSGERQDIIGNMMNDVAKKLTDDDIRALASYVSGLHS